MEQYAKNNIMFKIHSTYNPTGDQPEAIKSIIEKLDNNIQNQYTIKITHII